MRVMSMPVKVVLMAGGNGTRFWPNSTPELPKQFLTMECTGSLLQNAYARARTLVASHNIYVSTHVSYAELVLRQLPELPEENLILEFEGRDTAPALGLAAVVLGRTDPNTVMVALPSDHMVGDEGAFTNTLQAAVEAAGSLEALVTVGIQPERPETGYGYIQLGESVASYRGFQLHRVERFREKPTEPVARQYIEAGNCLWNAGMFVWRVGVFRAALARHLPELEAVLEQLEELSDQELRAEAQREVFALAPRISVDYGLLEKSSQVYSVLASFPWDDLGTWPALTRLRQPDLNGNITRGPVVLSDSKNTFVEANERVVAAIGVSNVIVVDGENGVLVCSVEHAHDVKKIAGVVRERNYRQAPGVPFVRVGGFEQTQSGEMHTWVQTPDYTGRFLSINAGKRLCYDRHAGYRSWFVQGGLGRVLVEGDPRDVAKGDVITIQPGRSCELLALTTLAIFEIAPGSGERE